MHKIKTMIIGMIILWSFSIMARPLNILFVVGHFPAPSQTFILNLMTSLCDRGHNVSIFSFHKDSHEYMHPDIEKYHLLDNVIYENFPAKLPECDIVFCQFGYLGKKIFRIKHLKQWLKNKKVVTCFRGSDITVRLNKNPHFYRKLFKKGDLFLPVCEYFKKRLICFGCNSKKIVVHHAAIDCARFPFDSRNMPVNGLVKVISVCRLVEKKGIKYAIEAVAKVVQQYPAIVYHIVGDGPEYENLTRLIAELHMQNNIILHGWRSQDDVIEMLDSSHIFLLPSVTAADGNEEGIPNALKEAMAMGLPVIATRHAGNAELIEDGISGYLVHEKKSVEISDKLMHLIQCPEVWQLTTSAARKVVEERFEIKKTIAGLENIFYRLLGK